MNMVSFCYNLINYESKFLSLDPFFLVSQIVMISDFKKPFLSFKIMLV
jgi:hypothetical protein